VRKRRRDPFAVNTKTENNPNLTQSMESSEDLDFWNPIEDVAEETEALLSDRHSTTQEISLFENPDADAAESEEAIFSDNDAFGLDDDGGDDALLFGTKKSRLRPRILVVSALIVTVLITGGVYLFVSGQARSAEEQAAIALREEESLRKQQQEAKDRYDAIMNGKTFLTGITVEGIDIGGMTRQEAKTALEPLLGSIIPSGKLPLKLRDQTFTFDLSLIQAVNNLDSVLDEAMKIAASEDMTTALNKADEIAANGHNFTLTMQHNFDSVTSFVADLAAQVNVPAKNAAIGTVDTVKHTVSMSEAVPGISVKENELVTLINNAILTGSLSAIEIPTESIAPTVTENHLQMIEIRAETSFKGSSSSRIYNIKKGADLMNGKVLAPGEVFSANDVLGVRTYKNGWKEANAYVGGTTEVQAGGGVCQLSSTLYNAVVKADLEVVSRRNHSMPVSYIKNGLDATINSVGNIIDFKFKNNTDCDLVVFAWTEDKTVIFKIIRCAFTTDEYDEIRLTAEKISTVYPDGEMEITVDSTLAPGAEEIDVPTQNGSVYQSYKNFYKNGEKVRSEKLAKSTYKAFNGSMRVGPSPSPSLTPIPAATPTQPPITVITPVPQVTPTPTPKPATPSPAPVTPEPITPDPVTPAPETPTAVPETPMVTAEIPVITEPPATEPIAASEEPPE